MSGAIDTRPVLTPERAGELLGLSAPIVRHLMNTGQLRCVDISRGDRRHRRTSAAWVAEYQTGTALPRESPVRGLQFAGRGANRGAVVG